MSAPESPVPPSRLKRWAPTLVGLAFAGVGLAATGVALSQVEISIRPPEAPTGEPDAVDLLRDDVATIQRDLQDLSGTLGQNLEVLAQGLEGNSEARHQEQAATLAALAARLDALDRSEAARSTQTERELAQLREAVARLRATGVSADGDTEPAPIAEAAPEEPVVVPTEPAATPAPAEVPAPPAPKRGLFSFKLAGGGPDFTHTQRYQVIGSLSRVGFDAKSTLHDFSGVTSKVEGTVVARLDQDDPHASATIRAAAATLKTGVDGRDEEMCKVLGAEEHPWIQFDLAGLVVTASDPEAKTYKGVGRGSFTIKGVTREVEVPVELSVDASRRLVASGEAKLNLLDFGLEVPSVAGAIKVEDEVKVWLSLRLRLLGDAEEGAR